MLTRQSDRRFGIARWRGEKQGPSHSPVAGLSKNQGTARYRRAAVRAYRPPRRKRSTSALLLNDRHVVPPANYRLQRTVTGPTPARRFGTERLDLQELSFIRSKISDEIT